MASRGGVWWRIDCQFIRWKRVKRRLLVMTLSSFRVLRNKSDSINNLVTAKRMNARFCPIFWINLKAEKKKTFFCELVFQFHFIVTTLVVKFIRTFELDKRYLLHQRGIFRFYRFNSGLKVNIASEYIPAANKTIELCFKFFFIKSSWECCCCTCLAL